MRSFSTLFLFFAFASQCHSDTPQKDIVRATEKIPTIGTRKSGHDWPRMLGIHYDSRSLETGILRKWPKEGLRVVWTANTGVGYGNGVSALGRWFQFDRFGYVERLDCMNADTGEPIWKWESHVEYRDSYGYNNGPRCSPVVDDDRVYVYGVAGTLACISVADGKEIWRCDTNERYNVVQNFFGVGASPLVYQDKLIVMVGGSPEGRPENMATAKPKGSAFVAFDKFTGEELYRVGDYLASYSAPVVHKVDEKELCLALVREGLMTFDPSTGKDVRFSPWRSKTFESVNAASPVVWRDKIIVSECYEIGSAVFRLADGAFVPEYRDPINRKDQLIRTHWSTPLLDGNTLLASSGRNEPDTDLRCLNLQLSDETQPASQTNISLKWTRRNRDRMTGLIVDGHALMLGEQGTLQLLPLDSNEFAPVAQMNLDQIADRRDGKPLVEAPSWAPPVLSHGLLYVRGSNRIVCLELIPEN